MFYVNQIECKLVVQRLANQSLNPPVGDHFPGGENMNLLSIFRKEGLFCYFCSLECFSCQWVGSRGMGQ